jgi:polynucleotide 5'-hydroxyl-kinase GRC3/NOL9
LKSIYIPKDWKALAGRLKKSRTPSILMVIGVIDTGKSTLSHFLFRELCSQSNLTALIDADLGQSVVGPPTTVGLSIKKGPKALSNRAGLCFVGSTSPRGHMLQTIVAVKKLVDRAISLKASHVVIDTSGFAGGPIGREFKFQKIDLVHPTHIIALEKGEELNLLLKNLSHKKGTSICRLKVSPEGIQSKSPEQRRLYRESRFKAYFKNAKSVSLPMEKIGLHGTIPDLVIRQNWDHLLIGLCDGDNHTLSLGIIEDLDLKKGSVSLISPINNINRVRSIQFGSIYLNKNGEER